MITKDGDRNVSSAASDPIYQVCIACTKRLTSVCHLGFQPRQRPKTLASAEGHGREYGYRTSHVVAKESFVAPRLARRKQTSTTSSGRD
jgi:hypothetical protein